MPNKEYREVIHDEMKKFIKGNTSGTEMLKLMNTVATSYCHYGIACEVDFRELTPLVERLFAYNNKHFYIYKAISDPNKIGFLSRKQYYKLQMMLRVWTNRGLAGKRLHELTDDFMSRNGTMGSPYKLLKRSFKENKEASKFLARFFPLEEDGKTTKNENKLIELCDLIMHSNTNVEIKDATVQECYNLDFHGSNINGSGIRYATNSCMYGKKVGAFYDAFGAHGKMVYYRGRPVGRFLLWDLPEEKGYIDRLYVRGEYANEVLAKIDEMFPDDKYYKYPYLRENPQSKKTMIKLTHPEALEDKPSTPYVDTFGTLYKDEKGEYYLSNTSNIGLNDFTYVDYLRSTSTPKSMRSCEHCHRTYWTGDRDVSGALTSTRHKLYCTGYKPRERKLQAYLEIFRKNENKLRSVTNEEKREFIF